MPQVTCPSCNATLRSANPIPEGKTVKCPKCGQAFSTPKATASGISLRPVPERRKSAVCAVAPAALPQPAPRARRGLKWAVRAGVTALLLAGLAYGVLRFIGSRSGPEKPADTAVVASLQGAASVRRKPIDTTYIAGDFTAALVVQPARTLNAVKIENAAFDKAVKDMVDELGVSPKDMEQVVVLLDPYPAGRPSWEPVAPDWKEHRFTGFVARFPVNPLRQSLDYLGSVGGLRYAAFVQAGKGFVNASIRPPLLYREGAAYVVNRIKIPADQLMKGVKGYLDNHDRLRGIAAGRGRDITLEGHPGKEYALGPDRFDPEMVEMVRIIVVGDQLYEISAAQPKAAVNEADAKRFVESFKPLPTAKPAEDVLEFASHEILGFPGFIVQFRAGVDANAALKKALGTRETRTRSHEGKEYLTIKQWTSGIAHAVCVADERTVLAAPETTLRKMLSARGKASSPLIDRLDRLDLKYDVNMVVETGPYKADLANLGVKAGALRELPGMPPALAQMAALLTRTRGGALYMNVEADPLLRLVIEMGSADDADQIQKEANALLTFVRQLLPTVKLGLRERVPAAAHDQLGIFLDSLFEGISVERRDAEAVLNIKQQRFSRELADAVKSLVEGSAPAAQKPGPKFVKVADRIGGNPPDDKNNPPGDKNNPPGVSVFQKAPSEKFDYDPEPRLALSFRDDTQRFGISLLKERDPNDPDTFKRLTFSQDGTTNNACIWLDGQENLFGQQPGVWARDPKNPAKGKVWKGVETRSGRKWQSIWRFTENVHITQTTMIVPNRDSGLLDTVLIHYRIENRDVTPHKVGLRVMLDTYVGATDGVPIAVPGRPELLTTKLDMSSAKDIPSFLQALERPDLTNPGTVAHLVLKLPPGLRLFSEDADLEPMSRVVISRWPGNPEERWEFMRNKFWDMNDKAQGEKNDSCVTLYWDRQVIRPQGMRALAFTYGLGKLAMPAEDKNAPLALTYGPQPSPGGECTIMAWVRTDAATQPVKLVLPPELTLIDPEPDRIATKGNTELSQVCWRVRVNEAAKPGKFPVKARLADREVNLDLYVMMKGGGTLLE